MSITKSKRKQANGLIRGVKILAFGLMLAVMGFIGLMWFLRPDTSVIEKRTLTEFPSITWSSFWDGSFFKAVDTWYADTYPLREGLISGSQSLENHYGLRSDQIVGEALVADDIPDPDAAGEEVQAAEPEEVLPDGTVTEIGEMQGQIYITNNGGYGLYYFTQSPADKFAATMNQIYANVKDKVNLYVMICPISAGVMLDQAVLDDMGCSSEKDAIDYIYGKMDPGIHTVSAFDNLKKHNAEYIYFHTDHHWTALGAYYAYQAFCQEKGIEAHNIADYETMEFPGFLGTFCSSSNNSPALQSNPDTVVAYIPKGTNAMTMHYTNGSVVDWFIVNDVSGYAKSELYATFVGGDRPFSYAHNPAITDGSAVMVIKDSYGNAFIPWLVDHYEYIYWVDARYTSNTISQMVRDYNVQDVIYEVQIYNSSTDNMLGKYAAIGQ
ncbi:MAG: DHHW family protein [Evtepia sp.]|nr:DHHW family protein [Evtepia sp.]